MHIWLRVQAVLCLAQVSSFADVRPAGSIPGMLPATAASQKALQGKLSLGQEEVAGDSVTRRSNSGPLSATMLGVHPPPPPPSSSLQLTACQFTALPDCADLCEEGQEELAVPIPPAADVDAPGATRLQATFCKTAPALPISSIY